MYEKDFGFLFGEDNRKLLTEVFLKFMQNRNFYEEPSFDLLGDGKTKKTFIKCTPLWDVTVEFHYNVPHSFAVSREKLPEDKLKGIFILLGNGNTKYALCIGQAELYQIHKLCKNPKSAHNPESFIKIIMSEAAHKATESCFVDHI